MQSLIVDQIHPVVASGKLVLQQKLWINVGFMKLVPLQNSFAKSGDQLGKESKATKKKQEEN